MKSTLAAEITAALKRCNRGGASYHLPGDFDLTPILVVNAAGDECTAVLAWQARIGDHVAVAAIPLYAVRALCPESARAT
jgi:hypothetical protein